MGASGVTGAAGATAFVFPAAFVAPAWPASRYGLTRVRLRFFAHWVAAIETDPAARPNCASIAAWLDGISPCCQVLSLGGVISKVSLPWTPNSSTRLDAWNAPQT